MPKSNKYKIIMGCWNTECKNYGIEQTLSIEKVITKGEKYNYIKSCDVNLQCADCLDILSVELFWETKDEN